ncbi:hypothetical protein [Streptomyces sp. NPDC020983]|uniref:hypothetical protein n=1 Tax=Streptomyces sp. NPDC020983 TaxID=3365106 RepID=UPI00378A5565
MGAKAVVSAGVGAVTGVGGAVVGSWPVAVLLVAPFAAVLAVLVWVLADQEVPWPGRPDKGRSIPRKY